MRMKILTQHLLSAVEFAKTIDLGKSPQSWDDLTSSQVLFICKLFAKAKQESNFLTRVALFVYGLRPLSAYHLKGFNYFLFRSGRRRMILSAEQVASLAKKFSWLTGQSDLTRNMFPVLRVGLKKYYGPEEKLFNLNFAEYQSAENFFLAFNTLKEVRHLDLLVATLYRLQIKHYKKICKSPSFKGDRREEFNDYLVEARAKKINRISIAHKYAVYQYFMGCISYLKKTYPLVFQESSGGIDSNSRLYNHTMLVEYLKGDNINADPLKENVYQIMARCQKDRLRSQQIENQKKNV